MQFNAIVICQITLVMKFKMRTKVVLKIASLDRKTFERSHINFRFVRVIGPDFKNRLFCCFSVTCNVFNNNRISCAVRLDEAIVNKIFLK